MIGYKKNIIKINSTLLNLKISFKIFLIVAGIVVFKPLLAQENVTVNIVSQPLWGPVGYNYAQWYYLPEAEVYYYIPTKQFIYLKDNKWVYASSLPGTYPIDLFRTYKVVLKGPKPYSYHKVVVSKYGKYKSFKGKQMVIKDSPNKKYFVVRGHPGKAKVKVIKPKSASHGGTKSGGTKYKGVKHGNTKGNSKPGNPNKSGSKGKNGKK